MNDRAGRGGRERRREGPPAETRAPDYRHIRNPFTPQPVFSEDRVVAIHETSLRVLEELGIRVLLPEARALFARAGARVDEATQMVFIGRDIVAEALRTAPKSVPMTAGSRARDLVLEPGVLTFLTGSGCPHVTDVGRGRRPGTLADFEDIVRLTQSFDVLHAVNAALEPQDVPIHVRH